MEAAEKSRLIGEIAVRHKVRLDEDDPAFILVELNRLALESTAATAAKSIEDAAARLVTLAERLPVASGSSAGGTEEAARILDAKTRALEAAAAKIVEAMQARPAGQAAPAGGDVNAGAIATQLAAVARVSQESAMQIEGARKLLQHAVGEAGKAYSGAITEHAKQVAAYEKTVLGVGALVLAGICIAAGYFGARLQGSASPAAAEFSRLNNVAAMLDCRQFGIAQRIDNETFCVVQVGNSRIRAWRVQ